MKFIITFILLFLFGITVYTQEKFPKQLNLSEVEIKVKRDGSELGCINCTLEYEAVIDGYGIVNFQRFVGKTLKKELYFAISIQQVEELLKDFEEIDFFNLEDKYFEEKLPSGFTRTTSHSMIITTRLKIGDKSKSIKTFYGTPKKLVELEKKIHKIIADLVKTND